MLLALPSHAEHSTGEGFASGSDSPILSSSIQLTLSQPARPQSSDKPFSKKEAEEMAEKAFPEKEDLSSEEKEAVEKKREALVKALSGEQDKLSAEQLKQILPTLEDLAKKNGGNLQLQGALARAQSQKNRGNPMATALAGLNKTIDSGQKEIVSKQTPPAIANADKPAAPAPGYNAPRFNDPLNVFSMTTEQLMTEIPGAVGQEPAHSGEQTGTQTAQDGRSKSPGAASQGSSSSGSNSSGGGNSYYTGFSDLGAFTSSVPSPIAATRSVASVEPQATTLVPGPVANDNASSLSVTPQLQKEGTSSAFKPSMMRTSSGSISDGDAPAPTSMSDILAKVKEEAVQPQTVAVISGGNYSARADTPSQATSATSAPEKTADAGVWKSEREKPVIGRAGLKEQELYAQTAPAADTTGSANMNSASFSGGGQSGEDEEYEAPRGLTSVQASAGVDPNLLDSLLGEPAYMKPLEQPTAKPALEDEPVVLNKAYKGGDLLKTLRGTDQGLANSAPPVKDLNISLPPVVAGGMKI